MNGKTMSVFVVLCCVAVLLAACRPVQRQTPTGQAGATAGQAPAATAGSAEAQIANAMSAAPLVVAEGATILGWPAEQGSDMVVLRTGTNGWTCYPDWPASPSNDPECNDPAFEAWFQALMAGAKAPPELSQVGIAYMLMGGTDTSNTDPMAQPPANAADWVVSPPHVMLIAPRGFDPADFSTDPESGEPYIMWEGNPYEHLMVPVVPAAAPANGPLTAEASTEEQIQNIRSAAPAAIIDDATWQGYPTQAGGDMVILQEGTNGWICHPDRLVSPGDDPACDDPTVMEGFTNATARKVSQVGISYMLAGGSDESNTDPMASGPAEGEDWVTTPPHLMLMAPAGFDAATFTTDHTSGYPYIMYAGTDYEHLMIPVADMPDETLAFTGPVAPSDMALVPEVYLDAFGIDRTGIRLYQHLAETQRPEAMIKSQVK